jgi:hypothetical protein
MSTVVVKNWSTVCVTGEIRTVTGPGVGVRVGVCVGVFVIVGVFVMVGVFVDVAVGHGTVGQGVGVNVCVGVFVMVGVSVSVGVGGSTTVTAPLASDGAGSDDPFMRDSSTF